MKAFLAVVLVVSSLLLASCQGRFSACASVDCSNHGTCYEIDGNAFCHCLPGFEPTGLECSPISPDGDVDGDIDGDEDGDVDGDVDGDADGDVDGDGCSLSALNYDDIGNGFADDPYIICTSQQWLDLAHSPDGWDANFALAADISLAPADAPHPPIGNEETPFSGVFDGREHIVSGFTNHSRAKHLGLFGFVCCDTLIQDIAVQNADIISGELSGALIGFLEEGTLLRSASLGSDCYIRSQAWANHKGGLIGETGPSAVVVDVFSNCRVGGDGAGIGGLIGHHEGRLTNGYYHHPEEGVGGSNRVGGLIGWSYSGAVVENTFTAASVQGDSAESDVALHIGTASGLTGSSYYDPSFLVSNVGSGGTTENGIGIDTYAEPAYFHNSENPPLSSWDFETVWQEIDGDYPVLAWLL